MPDENTLFTVTKRTQSAVLDEGEGLAPATLNPKGTGKPFSGPGQKQPRDTAPSICFLCGSVISLHGAGSLEVPFLCLEISVQHAPFFSSGTCQLPNPRASAVTPRCAPRPQHLHNLLVNLRVKDASRKHPVPSANNGSLSCDTCPSPPL